MRGWIGLLAGVATATIAKADWQIKQTYVINRNDDTARMESMIHQLGYLQIPYYRVKAVDKRDLRRAVDNFPFYAPDVGLVDNRLRRKLWQQGLSKEPFTTTFKHDVGAAACTFSHLNVLMAAVDNVHAGWNEQGPILVFEDDVRLDAEFVKKTKDAIDELSRRDPDWSWLALGYCNARGVHRVLHKQLIARPISHHCAHAYVVRDTKAAHKVLRAAHNMLNTTFPVYDDLIASMYATRGLWRDFRVWVYVDNDIAVQDQVAFEQHIPSAPAIDVHHVKNPIPQTRVNPFGIPARTARSMLGHGLRHLESRLLLHAE